MDQMTMEELGEPLVDTILKPGEMLYMPAGVRVALCPPPLLLSASLQPRLNLPIISLYTVELHKVIVATSWLMLRRQIRARVDLSVKFQKNACWHEPLTAS